MDLLRMEPTKAIQVIQNRRNDDWTDYLKSDLLPLLQSTTQQQPTVRKAAAPTSQVETSVDEEMAELERKLAGLREISDLERQIAELRAKKTTI